MTNSELWKNFSAQDNIFTSTSSVNFYWHVQEVCPRPLKKDKIFCQYCIRILKAFCITNLIWLSVRRERHQALRNEISEGNNSKGFSSLLVCSYKNNILGSEDSARNIVCVSGLNWTFKLLTNISENWYSPTLWPFEALCGVENHMWSLLWSNWLIISSFQGCAVTYLIFSS